MKLKTKIVHSFEIEESCLDDLDFNMAVIEDKKSKKQTKIVIERTKKQKIKDDASTRLF